MEVKMQAIGFALGVVLGLATAIFYYRETIRQQRNEIDRQELIIRDLENRISRQRRSITALGTTLQKKIVRVA
jgi:predicted histidine transporter YuiF (NhaC family)